MMNCIAVDDEKLVLDLLVDNINKVPFLRLEARCKNALEAAAVLHEQKVDLIFLDIQMPGLNGLNFVRSLRNPPMVIFVTAYKEHALEGFELDAVDYLLKPVSFERFLKACNKAYDLFQLQQRQPKQDLPGYFFVYVEYNQVKITISEILYVEAMKDYVKIFMENAARPVITKMSLKSLEEWLSGYRFIRIHKSYLVSADKITSIKRDLICIGDKELPVSETYRQQIDTLFSK